MTTEEAWEENVYNFVIRTAPADGLELLDVTLSAGRAMT